jgi:hypothetical protein
VSWYSSNLECFGLDFGLDLVNLGLDLKIPFINNSPPLLTLLRYNKISI